MSLVLSNKDSVIDLESSLSSSDSVYQSSSSARRHNPDQDTTDTASTSGPKVWTSLWLNHWLICIYLLMFIICLNRVGDEFQILGLSLLTMLRPTPPGRVETTAQAMPAAQLWRLIQWTCLKACKRPCSVPTWKLGNLLHSSTMQWLMLKDTFLLHASGVGYTRKEVPLHVLPTSSLLQLSSPLASFKDLQRVLYEEERAAYHQSVLQSMRFFFKDSSWLLCIPNLVMEIYCKSSFLILL